MRGICVVTRRNVENVGYDPYIQQVCQDDFSDLLHVLREGRKHSPPPVWKIFASRSGCHLFDLSRDPEVGPKHLGSTRFYRDTWEFYLISRFMENLAYRVDDAHLRDVGVQNSWLPTPRQFPTVDRWFNADWPDVGQVVFPFRDKQYVELELARMPEDLLEVCQSSSVK